MPYSPRSLLDREFHAMVRSNPWPEKGWPAVPAALRHNRLGWWAACFVVGAVEIQLEDDIEVKNTTAILGALLRTGKTPDIAGAWEEFAKRWGLKRIVLPVGVFRGDTLVWLHRGGNPRGRVTFMLDFSLPLAMWLLLSEPEVCRRVRQCPECSKFFVDPTQNRSKIYCEWLHTHRAKMRDYRADGKEPKRRRKNRVTTQHRN